MLESINIVYAFADKRTLREHVLIDIGDGARVRVDPRLVTEQSRIARLDTALQAHRDPGLQNAITLDDALFGFIIDCTIQGVRDRAGKLPGSVARQLRIRVERNDVFHLHQYRRLTDNARKTFARTTAQKCIQLGEFASLAFVTHPDPLGSVPAARAMKQEESVVRRMWIFVVECRDSFLGHLHQGIVLG